MISYHSLEDRLVKRFIDREKRDCLCPPEIPACVCGHQRVLKAADPTRPSGPRAEEEASNSRARSARLRAAASHLDRNLPGQVRQRCRAKERFHEDPRHQPQMPRRSAHPPLQPAMAHRRGLLRGKVTLAVLGDPGSGPAAGRFGIHLQSDDAGCARASRSWNPGGNTWRRVPGCLLTRWNAATGPRSSPGGRRRTGAGGARGSGPGAGVPERCRDQGGSGRAAGANS